MLEELRLDRAIEVADLDQVRSALAGLPLDQRLRALAECTILIDGPELAVFKAKWLGDFESVVLNIDDTHSDFPWQALDHLFGKLDARSVSLASQSRDAGDRFRAIFVGYKFGSVCCDWRLEAAEYAKAVRPVRDDRVVQIPPPLSSKERKAIKAAMR
jgi:hypothetical protein